MEKLLIFMPTTKDPPAWCPLRIPQMEHDARRCFGPRMAAPQVALTFRETSSPCVGGVMKHDTELKGGASILLLHLNVRDRRWW